MLTLIDFPSLRPRNACLVFDMKKQKLLFASVVSHGKNSGENYATSFSNEYGSYKSSWALSDWNYLSGKKRLFSYPGWTGERCHDKARERAIVMHGAAYADPAVASRVEDWDGVSAVRLFPRSFPVPLLMPSREEV